MTPSKKGHFSTLKSDSKLLKKDPQSYLHSWKVTGSLFNVEKWPGGLFFNGVNFQRYIGMSKGMKRPDRSSRVAPFQSVSLYILCPIFGIAHTKYDAISILMKNIHMFYYKYAHHSLCRFILWWTIRTLRGILDGDTIVVHTNCCPFAASNRYKRSLQMKSIASFKTTQSVASPRTPYLSMIPIMTFTFDLQN